MTTSVSEQRQESQGSTDYVGRHVRRVDSEKKVDGTVEYTDDFPFEGYYATVVRSNVAHGEIVDVDTTTAEAHPDVVAVVTGRDLEEADWISPYVGPAYRDQPVLCVDRVRYIGDPVAAVVATNQSAAEEAAGDVAVDYEPLDAVYNATDARADDAPIIHENPEPSGAFEDLSSVHASSEPNVAYNYTLEEGDVETAFAEADHVVEGTYTTPMAQHAHLEPFVTVADYDPDTDSMFIRGGNQTPHFVRQEVARILDLPTSRVEVQVPQMGGSYGAKTYVRTEPLAAALSRYVESPVKVRFSASESFDTAVRDGTDTRVKTGVTADGDIIAQQVDVVWDTGAYADIGPRKAKKAGYTAPGAYDVPNVSVTSKSTYTNKPPAVAYRGFGVAQTAWAVESHVDDIAAELDMDPYELRLRNIVEDGGTYNGSSIGQNGIADCLQAAVDAVDWLDTEVEQPAADHLVSGRGLAITLKATITPSTAEAIVLLDSDGSVNVITGSTKVGQGVQTTMSQLAASEFEIDIDCVTVNPVNTSVAPFNTSTTSSRTTFHVGNAISRAIDDIKEQVREHAASEWGIRPADVEVHDGAAHGPDGERMSLAKAVRTRFIGGGGTLIGRGYYTTELGAEGAYESAFWMSGATVAEVTVDTRSGKYRLDRWVNVTDAGKAVDPERVRGQMLGAATVGLGHLRSEEMLFEGGQQVNKSLLDYKLPTIEDVPDESEVVIVEGGDPDGPQGAKGVGEANTTTVPPSVSNAIRDATGARVHDLPVTPERVLRQITEGDE